MRVFKAAFDEVTFIQNGDHWTIDFATEAMADEVLKRCDMHDDILRCLEEMRDYIYENCPDTEDIDVFYRATQILIRAERG